jgi:hypothetical protein
MLRPRIRLRLALSPRRAIPRQAALPRLASVRRSLFRSNLVLSIGAIYDREYPALPRGAQGAPDNQTRIPHVSSPAYARVPGRVSGLPGQKSRFSARSRNCDRCQNTSTVPALIPDLSNQARVRPSVFHPAGVETVSLPSLIVRATQADALNSRRGGGSGKCPCPIHDSDGRRSTPPPNASPRQAPARPGIPPPCSHRNPARRAGPPRYVPPAAVSAARPTRCPTS